MVKRPVREVVRLMNVDNPSLLDDIRAVQEAARKIIDDKKFLKDDELIQFEGKLSEEENIDVAPGVNEEN